MVSRGIVNKDIKDKVLSLKCTNTNKEYNRNIRQCVMKDDEVPVKEADEHNIVWKIWMNGTAGHIILLNTQQVKEAIKKR